MRLHNEKHHSQAFYRWPDGMSILVQRVERPTNKPELLQKYIGQVFSSNYEVFTVESYLFFESIQQRFTSFASKYVAICHLSVNLIQVSCIATDSVGYTHKI